MWNEMSTQKIFQKETISLLKKQLAKAFNLSLEEVWADGNCVRSVENGRKSYHDLKFTLRFPEDFSIGQVIRISQAVFGWSIFHTCSLDYSKFTNTVSLEFEINYDTCQQIINTKI